MGIFQQFPYSNFHEFNLDEIIKICKQLTEEWAQYQADWGTYMHDMNEAFNDLKNYVNNYFANLDLDDAISDKINAMIADGSMEEVLEPIFTSLKTRVTALESAVAALTPIPESGTSADAALDNIKIDYNGYTYDSPGNSVRGQVRESLEKLRCGNYTAINYPFGQDLIDHASIITGSIINSSGNIETNSAGAITPHIEVSPGMKYLLTRTVNSNSIPNAAFYDYQGAFVSAVSGTTQSFIVPYNAYSVRINFINNSADPSFNTIHNQHLYLNPELEPYYDMVHAGRNKNIAAGVPTYQGLLRISNGVDNVIASASFEYTDMIPVINGETYAVSLAIRSNSFPVAIIYNSDGTVSRQIMAPLLGTDSTIFTITGQEKFIKINHDVALDDIVCRLVHNDITGKVCTYYGDSLTWYNKQQFTWGPHQGEVCHNYIQYISDYFMPNESANGGASGLNTLLICDLIESANNFNLTDYLFIMPSSMNDDRLDSPVGSLVYDSSTYDRSTIIGALQHAIETIYSQNPGIVITLITEPKGWTYRNNNFEMVDPKYVNAYKAVADFYGIPVIDCWSKCGFNKAQWSLYYADPTNPADNQLYIYHPNNDGWEKLSAFILNELDNLYSIKEI